MRTIAKACGAWIVWGCLAALSTAEGISWQTDLETARQAAAASNRLILMHFSATWCHWCKPLEKNVFAQPEVARAVDASYVAVRMDYDQHRAIAKQYGVKGVPWDVVITPDGSWVEDFNSPQTAGMYAARVTKIASREAAKMSSMYAAAPPAGPTNPGPPATNSPPSDQPYGPGPGLATAPAAAPSRHEAIPASSKTPADDRYADYYASRQAAPPQVDALNPAYANQVAPGASTPMASNQLAAGPPVSLGGAPALNPPGTSTHTAVGPALGAPAPGAQLSAGGPAAAQPVFALEGYCPVHLLESETWVLGDRQWGAVHRGKTYLFISEACRDKFLKNPDHYAPALSGSDPVALVDHGQMVEGRRQHGCFFGEKPNRRVVLFANEASFDAFQKNRQRYAGQIFAPQP